MIIVKVTKILADAANYSIMIGACQDRAKIGFMGFYIATSSELLCPWLSSTSASGCYNDRDTWSWTCRNHWSSRTPACSLAAGCAAKAGMGGGEMVIRFQRNLSCIAGACIGQSSTLRQNCTRHWWHRGRRWYMAVRRWAVGWSGWRRWISWAIERGFGCTVVARTRADGV